MIGATALTNPHFSDLPKTLDHTLPKVIAHVAARYGDTPFIVGEDGTRISFAQFKERVDDLARALIAHGVAYGDRVAIWAPNHRKTEPWRFTAPLPWSPRPRQSSNPGASPRT